MKITFWPQGMTQMYLMAMALLVALTIGGARAADLNAPINTTPTLGSEIKRGFDAVDSCDRVAIDANEYALCISGVQQKNRQNVVEYKPFDVGLFFGAWLRMDIYANPSSPPANAYALQVAHSARREAASMLVVYRDLQKQVGVTDEQVIAASGIGKSYLEARLAVYDSHPALQPEH